MSKLVELFQSTSTVEVQLIHQRLKDHGIPTAIQGEHLASQMGIASFVVPCRLMVQQGLLAEAQATLAVMAAGDQEALEGSPESCPACGEPWEPGYGECWNCQEPLPQSPS